MTSTTYILVDAAGEPVSDESFADLATAEAVARHEWARGGEAYTKKRITLKDDDVVKVNGKRAFNRQRFGTVSGYAEKYREGHDVQRERIERAIERGHKLVWLNAEAVVIAANPASVDRSYVAELNPGDEVVCDSVHAEERGVYRVELPGRLDGDQCQLIKIIDGDGLRVVS